MSSARGRNLNNQVNPQGAINTELIKGQQNQVNRTRWSVNDSMVSCIGWRFSPSFCHKG